VDPSTPSLEATLALAFGVISCRYLTRIRLTLGNNFNRAFTVSLTILFRCLPAICGLIVIELFHVFIRRNTGGTRPYAYRYGGEEFLVALRNHSSAEAAAFAERLRAATESKAFAMGSQEIRLTISIGVASFPHHRSKFAEVVHAANLAEHQAKAAGRNRVVEAKSDSKASLL